GGRGVLSIVQQPPPGGKLRRLPAQSVPQWGDGARAGNQQGRQRQGAQNHDRARLAVAPLPARQRLEHLVPRTGGDPEGADPAHYDRGAGAQAPGGALALSRDRPDPTRRAAQSLTRSRPTSQYRTGGFTEIQGGCVTGASHG